MRTRTGENITELLRKVRAGEEAARTQLMTRVYPELRRLAGAIMRTERPGHTLQPTALVNEVYLRLAGSEGTDWQDRAHFFSVAAIVMRQVLVDHARKWAAAKRGGRAQRVDLDDSLVVTEQKLELILSVSQALERLTEFDPRQARIVEMRFFGGMTEDEIAEVLGFTVRTVRRDWRMAKAWLYGELGRSAQ